MRFYSLFLIAAITVQAIPSPNLAACQITQSDDSQTKALLDSDRELRAKAKQLARTTRKIRINARHQDWGGVPSFEDNVENDCQDESRDIVQTSVAVLSDRILVLLKTRGRPSQAPNVFWVDIDIMGSHAPDFQIGFSQRPRKTFWIFEKGEPTKQSTIQGIKYKIDSHLIAEIPIASIKKAFKKEGVEFPTDALERGWVRVKPFSYNADRVADIGATAACPVLDRNEFFDKPIEAVADASKWYRKFPLPVPTQKWFVGQGAFGIWTHQSVYAYDLYIVDETLEPATTKKAADNEKYYCWEQDLVAPVKSRVIRTSSSTPDNPPYDETRRGNGNEVYLNIGGDAALRLFHCRQDSVAVKPGDLIEAGSVVAKVGNSASYTFAHLHLDLWKLPDGNKTMPAAFQNVRVSLNKPGDCPWSRDFSTWVVEEGWFVESLKARKPVSASRE
jgi:hypothetical protein